MSARDYYRQKAAECLLVSETLRDPTERLKLLELAHAYLVLALHVSDVYDYSAPHRAADHDASRLNQV
jgi:hypothetical protein